MIRVLAYIVVVAALAFGAVWLAERPGEVAITWQGDRLETSVMVAVATVAAIAVAAVLLWSILRAIMRAPAVTAARRRARRNARGHRAVSHGLIAVGSGDMRAARRFTQEANRFAPGSPLTLLLSAQAAQLAGDRNAAAATFQQMASRDDTRVLGLHGLFVEAQRRNDTHAALFHAEEAAKHPSAPGWAGHAVLEMRCGAGDWSGALTRLERNMKSGLIDKAAYRRQRAVLLTAQALALEEADAVAAAARAELSLPPPSEKPDANRELAKTVALEAVKLAPTLIPAAALAGRLLAAAGEKRKAARVIEAAWRANPHPDLADAYQRPAETAREKLTRIETLAAMTPGDVEAAIAVARAALDAKEFAIGKRALAPFTAEPTKRVAALMAALALQPGAEGRGRDWMARALNARRDPAWTADGFVSDRWAPISPVTGRLDVFEWKDPLAGEEHAGAVIDAERHAMLEPPPAPAPAAIPVPPPPAAVAVPPAQPAPAPAPTAQAATSKTANTTAASAAADTAAAAGALAAAAAAASAARSTPASAGDGSGRSATDSSSTEFAPRAAPSDGEPGRSEWEPGEWNRDEPSAPEAGATVSPEHDPLAADAPHTPPPVIPLAHAPDDPGPNANAEVPPDPAPEGPDAPPVDNWSRLRAMFKP
jgi:HemY protein